MKRYPLLWQLFPSYVLIILVSLALLSIYATRGARLLHHTQLERSLRSQAILMSQAIQDHDGAFLAPAQIARLCRQLSTQVPIRLTVIRADGRVIGDSAEDPEVMENHFNRPEVQAARRGLPIGVERFSDTIKQRMLYYVMPVGNGETPELYVRAAMPFTDIENALFHFYRHLITTMLVTILVAILLGLYVSRRWTRPLDLIQKGAIRFSEGQLDYRLPLTGSEEMAALSEVMNRMAEQLNRRMRQLSDERSTREAVFDSMTEGLLAIDGERRVIHVNRAALDLLGVKEDRVIGQPVEVCIRNASLQRLLDGALHGETPVEGDVNLVNDRCDVMLRARGSALRNPEGDRIGVLVVMQDVTHIRRLEQMRQDFVANVSHELKTPITSIKGFVETLQDGAEADPSARARFLGIIARQAEHLNAIVADLLLLSSVEHHAKDMSIPMERLPLRPILEHALEVSRSQAEAKGIGVNLNADPDLCARISPHLFEQAVANLVDNAIKYSPSGSAVQVTASPAPGGIVIEVQDRGSGIESRHLDRLFERFYRVDKGRSRQLGGTGLGLAIVKHIATAHGGRITVQSKLGEGSVFRIHLPQGEPCE